MSGTYSCRMYVLTSTKSPTVMFPFWTSFAASARDSVMPTVMITAWPMFRPVRDWVVLRDAFCDFASATSYTCAMCGSAQKSLTVSKLSNESVAFWLNTSSASVCCRLNLFLHSVNGTVKAM